MAHPLPLTECIKRYALFETDRTVCAIRDGYAVVICNRVLKLYHHVEKTSTGHIMKPGEILVTVRVADWPSHEQQRVDIVAHGSALLTTRGMLMTIQGVVPDFAWAGTDAEWSRYLSLLMDKPF